MRKIKRIKYNIIQSIVGMDLEEARKICEANGYKLGGNIKFWSVSYKIDSDNKIMEACLI